MLKIGLTGGIASGKSTICELFSQLNIPIIDADIIARELVEPGKDAYIEIVRQFGNGILEKDQTLNRKKLRKLIFSDPSAKKKLEAILHPQIRLQLEEQSAQQSAAYCILAIPLLIESKMTDLVDHIIVVDTPDNQQIKRLCQRDKISKTDAITIIQSQSSREKRHSIADDIINNNDSIDSLRISINSLHKKYCAISCQYS